MPSWTALALEVALEAIKVLAPVVSILIAASAVLQSLERGRRELAVSLIYNWAHDTDWATSRAITVLKELPSAVVDDIDEKRATKIPGAQYDAIVSILRREFPEGNLPARPQDSGSDFTLTPEQSAFIKYLWVRWLNRLEGTLAAWLQGAAAPELMRTEFAPLVLARKGELEILKNVRHGLPIIDTFVRAANNNDGLVSVQEELGLFPWSR